MLEEFRLGLLLLQYVSGEVGRNANATRKADGFLSRGSDLPGYSGE